VTVHVEDYGWSATAPGSSDYINPAIRALVGKTPSTALDAGCGNGTLAGELARDGHHVVGVDSDAGGIAHARTLFPSVRFEVATFDSDPALLSPDGKGFDWVVSTEVVEHLYSPHELPRFAFAALRPGGHLAISTPYHGYLKNLALSLTDKWDHHHTAMWHGGHIKFWSRATLAQLLREAGFEVTGFQGVGRLPLLWKSMILIARKPSR